MHNGIDLLSEMGAGVYASRNGKARVADQKNGMGIYVVLYHENNVNTTYGHLLKAEVKNGDFVRQGQLIGRVGKTGNANHPSMQAHLHFEIRKDGLPQDPMEYLE
jgi:murein DD-endopeptidase MepM/ murein hydrolase activator NlpD